MMAPRSRGRTPRQPNHISDADEFDRMLTAYLDSGDARTLSDMEDSMATTVQTLSMWSAQSGHAGSMRPSTTVSRLRTFGRALPAVAAAVLIVLSSIAVVRLWEPGEPTPQETPPVMAASGDEPSEMASADAESSVIAPLDEADCARPALDKAEAITMLQQGVSMDAPGSMNDRSGPWVMHGTTPVDATGIAELNRVLRGWEVCVETGRLYEAMAYQTDQYSRDLVYAGIDQGEPLSEQTLSELLDRREQSIIDAWSDHGELFVVWMIDETQPVMINPQGNMISASMVQIDPRDGTIEDGNPPIEVFFFLEDGVWKVHAHEPTFNPW